MEHPNTEPERFTFEFLAYQKNLRILQDTVSHITHIYSALKEYNGKPDTFIPVDGFPIVIGEIMPCNPENIMQWIYYSVVDNIIKGLAETLREAYKYLQIKERGETAPIKNRDELISIIEHINKSTQEIHIPALVNFLDKKFNDELKVYKDCILSINHLRNCIVHRNGVVSMSDLKDNNKQLLLKTLTKHFIVQVEDDSSFKLLTKELKEKGVKITKMIAQDYEGIREFNLGEKIILNYEDINMCIYTSIAYTNQVHKSTVGELKKESKAVFFRVDTIE